MNREIKFRAWDKKDKKIIEVRQLHFDRGLITEANHFFIYFAEIELMQYTGLKDKNGVDIYEGDIVTGFTQDGDENFNVKDVVEFENGKYIVGITSLYKIENIEVIGNIYETPSLLTNTSISS